MTQNILNISVDYLYVSCSQKPLNFQQLFICGILKLRIIVFLEYGFLHIKKKYFKKCIYQSPIKNKYVVT